MKRTVFGFFFFVLCCTSIAAQNKIDKINLSYGEELADDKQKIVKIIGESNDKIFALGLNKEDYYIKIFDSKSMKLLSSNQIVIPSMNNKEVDFEDICLLNDKLYAIGSVYNKSDKTFNLIGAEISEKGILSKNTVSLFNSVVAKKSEKGEFYFKQFNNKGDTMLIMHTSLFPKEDAVQYEVKLFDDLLKPLFTNTEKVKFDDSKKDYEFTIADFELNFQDDVFLVINESYRDSKKKEQIEKFEIHAFKKANAYQKEIINVDIKGKEIINCSLAPTNKNTLQVVGFYSSVRSNGKANKELKGVYNASINLATNANDNLRFNEFDYATKVKLLGERRAKNGKDLKPLYNITNIIEKDNGGLIVLSEMQYVYVGKSSGIGPLAFTPVTYTKNEIIVTCLKPDGSMDWNNVVAKEQSASITTMSFNMGMAFSNGGSFSVGGSISIPLTQMGKGPEYLGAIPIYKNDKLNILFNDNAKNKGITDIEQIKSLGNYNNAIPTLFVFDDKGTITRKDPEEVVKNQLVIRPGVYHRKNDHEYIVYSSRKSQDKLGRMILED